MIDFFLFVLACLGFFFILVITGVLMGISKELTALKKVSIANKCLLEEIKNQGR